MGSRVNACLFSIALLVILSGCDDPETLCIAPKPPEHLSGMPSQPFELRVYSTRDEVQAECERLQIPNQEPIGRSRACSSGNLIVLIAVGDENNYRNFGCDLLHETAHIKQREFGLPLNHEGWL